MGTLDDYLAAEGYTLEIVKGPSRQEDEEGWSHDLWVVRLVRPGATSPKITFMLGLAFDGRSPVGLDVFESLISDTNAYLHCDDADEFKREFSYESTTRAQAVYAACGQIASWFPAFVGPDWETIRHLD